MTDAQLDRLERTAQSALHAYIEGSEGHFTAQTTLYLVQEARNARARAGALALATVGTILTQCLLADCLLGVFAVDTSETLASGAARPFDGRKPGGVGNRWYTPREIATHAFRALKLNPFDALKVER